MKRAVSLTIALLALGTEAVNLNAAAQSHAQFGFSMPSVPSIPKIPDVPSVDAVTAAAENVSSTEVKDALNTDPAALQAQAEAAAKTTATQAVGEENIKSADTLGAAATAGDTAKVVNLSGQAATQAVGADTQAGKLITAEAENANNMAAAVKSGDAENVIQTGLTSGSTTAEATGNAGLATNLNNSVANAGRTV